MEILAYGSKWEPKLWFRVETEPKRLVLRPKLKPKPDPDRDRSQNFCLKT